MPQLLGIEYHIWGDYIAGFFALIACILCIIQIHHHIYHNHHPDTRKYIIRILLMVIVYCVESWFGLFDPELSLYLDTIRDTYEALVIYSFYQLLIYSLGGYDNVQHALLLIPMKKFPHIFPFNYCCKQWSFGQGRIGYNSFLRNTTVGVLQYCFVQPLMAIITFILHISHCHCYGEGEFNYKVGYPYICFIRSLSQTWAIYCLVLFYLALKKQPIESDGYQLFNTIRPIPKFLCIKGVVFFTYWQSVIIAGLVYLNLLKPTETWTTNNIAVGLQDILICIEMFFAAIAHVYAFKVDDFRESGYTPLVPPHKVLFDVANVTDLVKDASQHMFTKRGKKNKKRRRQNIGRSNTSLLDQTTQNNDDDDDDDDDDEYDHDDNDDDDELSDDETDTSLSNVKQDEMEPQKQRITKRRKRKKKDGIRYTELTQNKNSINSVPSTLERDLNEDEAL